ncbi:Uma2 family endonuclease [Sphingomonas adhaesiva]|uniref:Uma2 family endonuclease n=1 Tax=Sphingomonas adhaesiva TaxID=28212 RepID=UPI002FF86CE7
MTVQERLSPGKYRLTVEDYLRLAADGSFGDRRTELIEGDIWIMSPAYTPHARVQGALASGIGRAMASHTDLVLLIAPSVRLSDNTMPEPDLVIALDHRDGPLPGEKAQLVVEVSDATLSTDLGTKARLYAMHGVPEYWVVDVRAGVIHQMWQPAGDAYAERRELPFGDAVMAATIEGVVIETGALLPRG